MKSGSYQHSPERKLFEKFCDTYPSGLTPKKREAIWNSAQAVNGKGKPQVSDFKSQLNCEYYFDRETSGGKYFAHDYPPKRNLAVPLDEQWSSLVTQLSEAITKEDLFIDDTGCGMLSFVEAVASILFRDGRYIRIKRRLYKWCDTHYQYCEDGFERKRILAIAQLYDDYVAKYGSSTDKRFRSSDSVRKHEESLRSAKARLPQFPEQRNYPGIPCTNGVVDILWEGATPLINFVKYDPSKHFFTWEPSVRFLVESSPKEVEALFDFCNLDERDVFLRLVSASLQYQPAVEI